MSRGARISRVAPRPVVQHTLFTLYSKAEVLEALGRGKPGGDWRFRGLLEERYPRIRFDWTKLRRSLEQQLHVLPDLYDYREARLRDRLIAFAKQLMLADPTELVSSARLIGEHRYELEYVRDLIDWCLQHREQERTDWNADNAFYWGFTMRDHKVPPDVEAAAAAYYERGEYERAEVIFGLLVDAFEDYAEGYNYLGLIALRRGKLAEAIERFERTVEVGRRLFPKRVAKSRWWSDLATRPYIRGLSNLALTLVQAGRHVEALAACDRLEHECGEDVRAAAHRATAYLALGEWRLAMEAALHVHRLSPDESLTAALAAFELGELERARAGFCTPR